MTSSSQKIGYFLASKNTNQTRDAVFDSFSSLAVDVGYDAVKLDNLTSVDLEHLDILWVERPTYRYSQSNERAAKYRDNFDGSISQFVAEGGTLIYNDWTLGQGGGVDSSLKNNLPGYSGPNVTIKSFGRNVDIAHDEISNSDDPFRFIDDSSLDGNTVNTNRGSVRRADLDADIHEILLTDSKYLGRSRTVSDDSSTPNDEVISFAYETGDYDSDVVFTSIPVSLALGLDNKSGFNNFERNAGSVEYNSIQSNVGKYVQNLIDFVDEGSVTKDLVFSHRLYEADGVTEADTFTVSSFGTEQDKSREYILELYAHNKAGNGLDLNSFDFTLGFDSSSFLNVDYSDIQISSNFKYFNQASIDNESGTIRVTGASSEHLQGGSGIADGENEAVFRVSLDLDDDAFSSLNDLPSLTFNVSANDYDTVFLKDDVQQRSDVIVKTLGGLGGSAVVGLSDDPYAMDWQDTVEGSPIQLNRQSRDEIVFGTQRSIGSTDFTNLVRSGSTHTSSVSDVFISAGDSAATSARFKASRSDGYFGADLEFKLTHTKSKLGLDNPGRINATNGFSNVYEFGSSDSESIESGTLLDDGSRQANGDEVQLDYLVTVNGVAGDILDTSKLGVDISAAGGYRTTHYLGDTKNLITFQSDVNYDGRVSMADLAFVNAGAHLKTVDPSSDVSDVDINYDGQITIDDLQLLDEEWGQSLHDSTSPGSFTGSSQMSLDDLASQVVDDTSFQWSNASFTAQNSQEHDQDFDGSILDSAGGSVVVGSSSLHDDPALSDFYEDLQDSLI